MTTVTVTVIASALASATSIPNPYEGSWDKANEKYVLPNLVGLPYGKMVRNGMRILLERKYHDFNLV